MRLHRLEMEAFGPFAGREHVDLDRLADCGLFLLCGPTGSGKTSVLDAVCFALYGQVPGDRDKAKRLHSDHAPAGRGPRVVLEVSLRGRRLRITRSPEWTRPKKRGAGEVREHAKVLVEERVDGRWQQRTNRADEAGDLLGGLLGLTMTQFCQVALLPQGRFESFLRSGAQERHALLERLFGTHRFRAVEEWLAEHRRTLAARSAAHAERVAHVLERVAEASGVDRPDETDLAAGRAWADDVRRTTLAGLAEATETRDRADLAAKDARAALDAARDLADLQQRHREARRHDAELRALSEGTAALAARVERARLAAGLRPLVALYDAAGVRRDRAAQAVDDAHGVTVAEAVATVRRLQHDAAALEALLPLQGRHGELGTEVERTDDRLDTLEAEQERLRADADDREMARVRAREGHAAATAARARHQELQHRVEHAGLVADAAARAPELQRDRDALAAAGAEATEQALRAREDWLDLRQERLDGMAAELARTLVGEQPCPVCGATDHPSPADRDAAPVTPADERAAEHAWQRAEQRRQQHADELARCERELAAARATSEGHDEQSAAARLAELRTEQAQTRVLAERADALAAELVAADEAVDAARQRSQRLATERAQLTERRALLVRDRDDIGRRLVAAAGDPTALDQRCAQARVAVDRWTGLVDALREHDEADTAHRDADGRLEEALAEAGFESLHEARRSLMSRAELGNAETLLRRRADQEGVVRAVLDDAAVQAAAAEAPVALEPVQHRLADAERQRDEAVATERALAHRAARLDELSAELDDALRVWAPVRDSLVVAERMAGLCAGTSTDNRHRMRLSAYVLAVRLAQVVAAANERLLQMSSGRFSLRHTVARGVGDRRGGLGLQVHDGWTDDLRDPATLSGGETFFTSLALALGLADVVAYEAGSTEIGTLFVDEGFGSLDPDTLDDVMDVLDQLRSGGRAVGLVSHLADLRARVPAQVHVHKTRRGSTLRDR